MRLCKLCISFMVLGVSGAEARFATVGEIASSTHVPMVSYRAMGNVWLYGRLVVATTPSPSTICNRTDNL